MFIKKHALASYFSLFTPSILHIITPTRTGAFTCADKKIASFVISNGFVCFAYLFKVYAE